MTTNRRSTNIKPSPRLPSRSHSSSPKTTLTLTQQFADVLRRFQDYSEHIQRLLKETDRSYHDINDTRVLPAEQFNQIRISPSDRLCMTTLETHSLALIISSQTYNAKFRFVNELLNEPLLPETPGIDLIETVRIKIEDHPIHGASLSVTNTSDSEESASGNDRTVNSQTHSRQSTNFELQGIELSELRTSFNTFNDDLQLILTTSNSTFHMERIRPEMIPIFVYIIDQEILSDTDINELKIFHSIAPGQSILFIRIDRSDPSSSMSEPSSMQIFRQLCDLGFLSNLTSESAGNSSDRNSLFQNDFIHFTHFPNYIRKHLDRLLIRAVNILQQSHEMCLDFFNQSAFDMARDMLVTPKRLSYARERERKLYDALVEMTYSKQNDIQQIILQSVEEISERLADEAGSLDLGIDLTDQLTVKYSRDLKKCSSIIQDFVLIRLNERIANTLLESLNVLHDNHVGTLTRCLHSLENSRDEDELESSPSKALQEILRSAYKVNIALPENPNLLQILLEKMKELFRTLSWNSSPRIDPDFKRSVALNMLGGLDAVKLAKSVCAQLNSRIHLSHDSFETELTQLEGRHSNRLKSTEDKQQRVRKDCTPKIARLLLESTSLKDLIHYGLPEQGREVGRGQYGVVYDCKSWANHQSCVSKSVIPPDDRHWNDLALEFHYLRRIPDHPRIVKLIGSVIDYRNPDQTAVLLVMERQKRDLYSALRNRLEFSVRMRIALDVVEGLRYLHGLGLVHRDIKLKNVLLDEANRARLTDLGFCKPEVMMSGSLVGTPIHMAPELFSSKYDHTVDVYAFGILFWYICSNGVKLPTNFDVCSSKDVLCDECWEIMTKCWAPLPPHRPYLGEVQEKIEQILANN